jgi:hypothetical protein
METAPYGLRLKLLQTIEVQAEAIKRLDKASGDELKRILSLSQKEFFIETASTIGKCWECGSKDYFCGCAGNEWDEVDEAECLELEEA